MKAQPLPRTRQGWLIDEYTDEDMNRRSLQRFRENAPDVGQKSYLIGRFR